MPSVCTGSRHCRSSPSPWQRARLRGPRDWVHVAGVAWLTACTGALVQAVLDEAPMEPAPLSAVTLVALLAWSLTTAAALVSLQDSWSSRRTSDGV